MVDSSENNLFEVRIETLASVAQLERDWCDLETRASVSVFQTWSWINVWLQSAWPEVAIVKIYCANKTVALGVLARGVIPRPTGGQRRVVSLHETSGKALSKIAIEYNGLLCEAGMESAVYTALIRYLPSYCGEIGLLSGWREFRFPGCSSDLLKTVQKGSIGYRTYRISQAPYVSLSRSFSDVENYLRETSKNTREQVRRSMRIYESEGDIALVRPKTTEGALECLERLKVLHESQWNDRGIPGAFSNEAFEQFHKNFIKDAFTDGLIDLVEVKVAKKTIGILYNLLHGGIASAYQSGFYYESDNRIKPGLVCHALAISDYAAAGIKTYRFLAGGQRYKESLSNGADTLYWIALQRPDLRMRLENLVRQVKARFQMSQSK